MSKRFIALLAVMALSVGMTACANTIRGAGQDIANTTNAAQAAANNVGTAAAN